MLSLVNMDILITIFVKNSFSLVLILNPDPCINKKIAAGEKWRKDRNWAERKIKVYRKLRHK